MKSLKLFIYIFILITSFSVFGFSQTNVSRIATIDTEKFNDKQNGIKEFTEAVEKLETEFKTQTDEYNSKTEKSRQLYKEMNDFYFRNHHSNVGRAANQIFTDKLAEYRKSETEIREINNRLQPLYDKRATELLTPPRKKIRDAIKRFAKENGLSVILDSSKDLTSIIINSEVVDVTQRFIEFYNKNYAANIVR